MTASYRLIWIIRLYERLNYCNTLDLLYEILVEITVWWKKYSFRHPHQNITLIFQLKRLPTRLTSLLTSLCIHQQTECHAVSVGSVLDWKNKMPWDISFLISVVCGHECHVIQVHQICIFFPYVFLQFSKHYNLRYWGMPF